MAPEQFTDSREVDIRADLSRLGCTLYNLWTGRGPFELPDGRTLGDKAEAHRYRPVEPIRQLRPEIPAALAQMVHRMVAKDPPVCHAGGSSRGPPPL